MARLKLRKHKKKLKIRRARKGPSDALLLEALRKSKAGLSMRDVARRYRVPELLDARAALVRLARKHRQIQTYNRPTPGRRPSPAQETAYVWGAPPAVDKPKRPPPQDRK